MTYGTRIDGYPGTSKLLHWLVATCVLTTVPVAIAMKRVAAGPAQDFLFNFHKSLGVLILILMVLRLINRFVRGAPMPEPTIEPWQRALSSAVHGLIYVLLLALPVVGFIANNFYAAPLPFFGLFTLPPLFPENKALAETLFGYHALAGWILIGLVLMHVSGALFHHYIRGDNVLRRMLARALGGI